MFDSSLANAFGFSQDDLTHNQQGRLSPKQTQFFKSGNTSCLVYVGGATLAMLIVTLIAIALSSVSTAMPLIVFTLVGVGFLVWIWSTRNEVYLLQSVQGAAQLRTDAVEDGRSRQVLNVDGYDFTITPAQRELLQQGVAYKVYYAMLEKYKPYPKSSPKQIMSLERVE
jgi:hypothetical protein